MCSVAIGPFTTSLLFIGQKIRSRRDWILPLSIPFLRSGDQSHVDFTWLYWRWTLKEV